MARTERVQDTNLEKGLVVVGVLDVLSNIAIIVVTILVLCFSRDDHSNAPIRFWIRGFGFLSFAHLVSAITGLSNGGFGWLVIIELLSVLWWVFGVAIVRKGGGLPLNNAPPLYWLAVIFLAFRFLFFLFYCYIVRRVSMAARRIEMSDGREQ